MNKFTALLLGGLVIFIASGCLTLTGGKTGSYVSKNITEGQKLDEILKILAEGGDIKKQTSYVKPESGYWSDIIKDDRVLYHLLINQDKKHKQIQECISVGRGWGLAGLDVFYLFFDADKNLVGYWIEYFD